MGNLSKIRRKIVANPKAYYSLGWAGRINVKGAWKNGSPATYSRSYKAFVRKVLEDIKEIPVRQEGGKSNLRK